MDELFLCGDFCSIYMNLNWYTPVLLVIKPSAAVHSRLLRAALGDHPSIGAAAEAYSEASCQQAWEDFYMDEFSPLEAAPAFHPSKGQQHAPVMRLASGYAVNPIFWYEKYDWSLARVKEYANMMGNTVGDIPAHALGYPRFKPWNWIVCIYFNIHALWARWRYQLLDETFSTFLFGYASFTAAILVLAQFAVPIINTMYRQAPVTNAAKLPEGFAKVVTLLLQVVDKVGWTPVAYVWGLCVTASVMLVAWLLIPGSAIYFYAWPMYILMVSAISMLCARFSALIACASLGGRLTPARLTEEKEELLEMTSNMDKSASLTVQSACALLLRNTSVYAYLWPTVYMFIAFALLQAEIYPHFVLKILALMSSLTYWVILLCSKYSPIVRILYFSKPGLGIWRNPSS
jgi:hypothetical protein